VPRIVEPLYWDEYNVDHLWQSHKVTPVEVEELLFGVDGEVVRYTQRRDGDYLKIYGETGSGRLLKLVGEFMQDKRFRVFAAQDMNDSERRFFRKV
jgi:hypothetical protein